MRKYERAISVPVGEEQNTPHHSVTAWTVQTAEIGGAKPTWCANLPANMLQSEMSNAQLFACTLGPLQSAWNWRDCPFSFSFSFFFLLSQKYISLLHIFFIRIILIYLYKGSVYLSFVLFFQIKKTSRRKYVKWDAQ